MDLFESHLSKKDQLYNWMKKKVYVRTSEVLWWGTQNFCNTSDRLARKLNKEKRIRRMDEKEKIFRFGKIGEDVWTII